MCGSLASGDPSNDIDGVSDEREGCDWVECERPDLGMCMINKEMRMQWHIYKDIYNVEVMLK